MATSRKNQKTVPPAALYVGKDYAATRVLYVDLQGDGLVGQETNFKHPECDPYSAGTFLNTTVFLEPDNKFLNALVDMPSYKKAVLACKKKRDQDPLQCVASLGINPAKANSKKLLLQTIEYLAPKMVVFQGGITAKSFFADETFKRQLRQSCKRIFVVAHPAARGFTTPLQAMSFTGILGAEQYCWNPC